MNKLKLLTFLFASLLMLTLVSCSKDDDADLSKMDLLTGGEWTGHQFWTSGMNVTDQLVEFGYKVAKSKANFSKDGSYTMKYDGDLVQSGNWEFGSGEQTIILDEGTEDETIFTINKLTSSELYMDGEVSIDSEGYMSLEGEIRLKR
ncbi:hypothetical protein [Pontibacter anaerobius]|uniref:Lipocalin-like domain-containing protein n=1 Tax=Pontibacter anaerobius TaxID=2993940 RepID=A0ABT3RIH0_9BACT|nr:hypothetical protein [Pontibacter anaerobius]MCX2741614.1 hypothetical protein [Pontibacter anaerobius]